jgi:hypothetical protein
MDLRRNLAPFLNDDEFKVIENKFKEFPEGWMIKGNVSALHYRTAHKTLDELYIIAVKFMKEKGLLMPKVIDLKKAVTN